MLRSFRYAVALFAALSQLALTQSLPTSWVDRGARHRIVRLTDEAGSSGFKFNLRRSGGILSLHWPRGRTP